MIPKIIHYCWFGRGEKPELAKKCIASWKKFCPDFEIREWNEDNCDYLAMPFMAEAYAAKKYTWRKSLSAPPAGRGQFFLHSSARFQQASDRPW